ncbi:hypothetical protein [Cohnella terricola]|uniref:Uncharacterized protein n=1 Tax=Cohnella terricola TaxID=1289167 RepID=A0A559J5B0_9BACL|nr:hypothetical protein [Cohnella terricola]TVX95006.1 hypothetical protein FPZ45_24295 [Cohnella terricola]
METVNSVFRSHPELEPTGKLSILGEACCSAERMLAYMKRRNPEAPEVAGIYLETGKRYGIRGDVAYCQTAYETKCWTTEAAGPEWAPLMRDQWADEAAIETRMQMLYAFSLDLPLANDHHLAKRPLKHIENSGWRGKAPCWEDLNGKWSHPGYPRYGQDIAAMWRSMLEWNGKGSAALKRPNRPDLQRAVKTAERVSGSVDWSSIISEQMRWLHSRRLLPVPAPHPDRKVSWSELAHLIHRWENPTSASASESKEGKASS